MKPKTQRMIFIITGLCLMLAAAFFILNNFRDNLVFFYTPTEMQQKHVGNKIVRIGGLVVAGSISRNDDITDFSLTDTNTAIKVEYKGLLPQLFHDGQGIVAHGALNNDGIFIADNLLAKHDEKYMPPEVAEALKKSGKWRPEGFK